LEDAVSQNRRLQKETHRILRRTKSKGCRDGTFENKNKRPWNQGEERERLIVEETIKEGQHYLKRRKGPSRQPTCSFETSTSI